MVNLEMPNKVSDLHLRIRDFMAKHIYPERAPVYRESENSWARGGLRRSSRN